MATLRMMVCDDLLRFNNVNLDPFTETYNSSFYLSYMAKWPHLCLVAESPDGAIMGYIIGKTEGAGASWHGHVTAVTVAPEYRRLGLGARFMDILEGISAQQDCYFVDLFVRASNKVAIEMYTRLGYTVYRTVLKYYSGEEDALDMRKAMPRDAQGRSVVPLRAPVRAADLEGD